MTSLSATMSAIRISLAEEEGDDAAEGEERTERDRVLARGDAAGCEDVQRRDEQSGEGDDGGTEDLTAERQPEHEPQLRVAHPKAAREDRSEGEEEAAESCAC